MRTCIFLEFLGLFELLVETWTFVGCRVMGGKDDKKHPTTHRSRCCACAPSDEFYLAIWISWWLAWNIPGVCWQSPCAWAKAGKCRMRPAVDSQSTSRVRIDEGRGRGGCWGPVRVLRFPDWNIPNWRHEPGNSFQRCVLRLLDLSAVKPNSTHSPGEWWAFGDVETTVCQQQVQGT